MATAGWIPTIVDRAPSRRTIATSRAITRATNESTMDSPLTSRSTPVARVRATSRVTARSMSSTVVSPRLPCRVTRRFGPTRMIGTSSNADSDIGPRTGSCARSDIGRFPLDDRSRVDSRLDDVQGELQGVAQAVAAAQGAQLDAEVHDRLRGLRPYPAQDAPRTHEAGRL